jgi:protein ImuB
MLWIAIHLPLLSLEAFAATLGPAQAAQALALLDGARVTAVSHAAADLGVKPGLKRATALALAPGLLFGQADAARDAQGQTAVAHAALAFTPSVCLQGAHTVLLEVSTTLRAFGGLPRLVERLQAATQPLGLTQRLATAPTAGGAALLAQWGRADIDTLGPHSTDLAALRHRLDSAPVWLLGPGREHWEALQGMGLHTLADLRALPRAGLARRFGEALLQDLDRARGDAADPRDWLQMPERFESRLELFARADTAEQVLHGAATLLQRLVAWAGAQHARVARFTLAMQHEPRHRTDSDTPACTALDIALAEASNDPAHLQTLLRERLARLPLPAPTLELRLHAQELVRRAAPNAELFPTRASEREGLVRLVERLQARLGREQVLRVQRVADHRPERATRLQPLEPGAGPPREPPLPAGAQPAAHLTRPVWLLREPQPLAEQRLLPLLDGRPLQMLAGPERIEAGWWDGEPAARDYFVAQAHDGSLVWVYRARLPTAEGGWFLQGRFA